MKVISLEGERVLPEERCGGCRLCEAVCALVHERVANPKRSRIHILSRFSDDHHLIFDQVVCQQCSDQEVPTCAQACPSDAIYRDEGSGLWIVDSEECVGCGVCADECPYGAIFVDPVAVVALKCDLCGDQPQCVAICPSMVLTLVEA